MNKSIKDRTLKDVIIQLERAEVQKNLLIKKIYKEYEIYFQIVRKCIFNSVEKGIYGLYSEFYSNERSLNLSELNNFLKKKISLLINAKIPLITIEQLKLEDVSYQTETFVDVSAFEDSLESRKYEKGFFENDNEINKYEYYDSYNQEELLSINFDKTFNFNSVSKENSIKNKQDIYSFSKLIETNYNKLNELENINLHNHDFILSHKLDIFESIDISFSNLLSNISYSINSELFKINLIKRFVSNDIFKSISRSEYKTKHPHPFVFGYELNLDNISKNKNKSSYIYLFTINNVELEFFNLGLSICRSNINDLKNKLKLLNKKEKYWKNKELDLND